MKIDEAARFVVCAVIINQTSTTHSNERSRFISTVVRIHKEGKVRPVRRRALPALPVVEEQASLVALIQDLIPLGLQAVGDALKGEVTKLAGERYSRTGG
ncbi:MAG: hypothetical protein C4294_12160, partial [Nitrospiraceae bacterium]